MRQELKGKFNSYYFIPLLFFGTIYVTTVETMNGIRKIIGLHGTGNFVIGFQNYLWATAL